MEKPPVINRIDETCQQWSNALSAALAAAGLGCVYHRHTGSSVVRTGTLAVRRKDNDEIRYSIEFERKLVVKGDQRTNITVVECYNPDGGLHVRFRNFSPESVAKIVSYAQKTLDTKIGRKNEDAAKERRIAEGHKISGPAMKDFHMPSWARIRPNFNSDEEVGTFRLFLSDNIADWACAKLPIGKVKRIVDAIRAITCDHKFVDSKHCLKCGWTPAPFTVADVMNAAQGLMDAMDTADKQWIGLNMNDKGQHRAYKIMQEARIKLANALLGFTRHNQPYVTAEEARFQRESVKASATNNGWIPVSVPVPSHLVNDPNTTHSSEMKLLLLSLPDWGAPQRGWYYGGLLNEFRIDGTNCAVNPTHWMPLPPKATTSSK